MSEITKDWSLYQAGRTYNQRLNYYETVKTNIDFYEDRQWVGLADTSMPKPVFNIIKRVIRFFIGSLASSKTKIHFSPLLYTEDNPTTQMQVEMEASEIMDATVQNLLEKLKMENRIRNALFDAAITGDACAHFYFDPTKKAYSGAYSDIKGEICIELVDGTNVHFGNANISDVERQPYIIISGRDLVENLKAEAKLYRKNNTDDITSDRNFLSQAGDMGEIEVEADDYGKACYIIIYRKDKKTGTIKVSKSVEGAYIYKDIDTGLDNYPIAWLNWEKQKNTYHGKSVCTGMLPNQIFINRMFAMVMYHLMMTSFPKTIYNADVISEWTNEIGTAIPVRGLSPDFDVRKTAGQLEPGTISSQILNVIEMAMSYTKETLGVSDASLGNIKPENTSAIIALQKSSIVPLENTRANLYEWMEDIGKILFDMIATYYGTRPIVLEKDDTKEIITFDYNSLKDMWLNTRVDVGESSYWSEIASLQTLDNLLSGGYLDIIDYLERVPHEYIPRKQELIDNIKKKMEQPSIENEGISNNEQLYEQMAQFFESLPPEVQEELESLPPERMQQEIINMMQQQAPIQ